MLTPRQRAFCEYYILYGNATRAAEEAGYSKKNARHQGSRNLRIAEVRAYIEDAMAKKNAALVASQDEVLRYLTEVMRGQSREPVLVGSGQGKQRVAMLPPRDSDRIRAGDLLGRRYGIWTDRLEVSTDVVIEVGGYGDD